MDRWGKKRRIMQRYDLTAYMYDMRYSQEQTEKFEMSLRDVNPQKNNVVLDVGCGTGLLFDNIADKVETMVGLDISRGILLIAKKRARDFQNVHLIWADADAMPLREQLFNHVFAFTLIQNTPNPAETLREIRRVSRKDATIVVTGLKKAFTQESFKELLRSTGLRIVALKDKDLKCYVAVCAKLH